MSVYDRDMDVCGRMLVDGRRCDHVRAAHQADADFNGERYVMFFGMCEGEHEDGTACACESFEG